jgi:hypothetical protein
VGKCLRLTLLWFGYDESFLTAVAAVAAAMSAETAEITAEERAGAA